MREYTEGAIRKRQKRNGSWEWYGEVSYMEDGKQRRVGHFLGVSCDPKGEDEGRKSRGEVSGKGSVDARKKFKAWRDSLVEAEKQKQVDMQREADEAAALAAIPKYSRMSVPDFVRAYIASKEVSDHETGAMGIEASTLDNYRYVVKHLEYPELSKEARDLTPADVSEWVRATKENQVGASMRAKAFSLLKYACDWGIRLGYMAAPNPCVGITAPVKRERDKNPLDEQQLARLNALLDALDDDPSKRALADAARIAIHTGMRQGEICGIRWKDVDHWDDSDAWEHPERWNTGQRDEIEGYLNVANVISDGGSGIGLYNKPYPKGRRKRFIPIMPDLAETLAKRRRLMMEECIDAGVPFTGELYVLGQPVAPEDAGTGFYSPDYLGHQWSMFASIMSIRGKSGARAHFHDLRHTFAVHYLANGIPLATVAAILGHANSQTTARYYEEFLTEKQREAMRKMDTSMSRRATLGKVVQFKTGTDN